MYYLFNYLSMYLSIYLSIYPVNIRLDEEVLKTSWRHFSSSSLKDVFKTSWSRPIYLSCPYVFKTSSDVFKTSSRHLQDVFNTSSKRLANPSWRHLLEVLKTYHQVKLFLLTSLWEVFDIKTYCKDRYQQKDSPRSHFWEIYGKCRKFARVIKISQVLVFHFTTPFSGCL